MTTAMTGKAHVTEVGLRSGKKKPSMCGGLVGMASADRRSGSCVIGKRACVVLFLGRANAGEEIFWNLGAYEIAK